LGSRREGSGERNGSARSEQRVKLRQPIGAVKHARAVGGREDDAPGVAGWRVGEDGNPVDQVAGGLDDVSLVSLAIEPKVECVGRIVAARPQPGRARNY